MKSIFTVPKVVKYDDLSKPWFVFFRYDGKLIRKKYGINYINNYKKRLIEANLIRDALYEKLREGWNPFLSDLNFDFGQKMTIPQALEFAMEKKSSISPATLHHYNLTVKWTIEAVKKLNIENALISDIKRPHIKLIMDEIKKSRKWSNKAYNKNLGYLRAIIGELIEWNIIEHNPASKIKSLKVAKTNANIPATDDQSKIIKEFLENEWFNFYVFIITIFHTGIRPEEILQMKISMIDFKNLQINLPPEITKTDIYRIVPLNKYFIEYLKKLNLERYPKDYFVFGTLRGNKRNRGISNLTDFVPGPENLHSDTATKLWRKLVKVGLGIDVNLYSMKHLGADKKILAGVELDALKELYGHTSKLTTLTYAKVVKEVNRKQIMELSPDF
jgi:integrase